MVYTLQEAVRSHPSVPFPTVDEFKDALRRRPLENVVREYVFEGLPYAFKYRPETMQTLRRHLVERLGVRDGNVTVIGSAKIGFSLSPDNFPRAFSKRSDVDVLVVDESLFDRMWHTLLRWNYPRRFTLGGTDWQWAKKRRNDLYWGWLVPDKIRFNGLSFPDALKPVRDISTTWFNTFRSLSLYSQFASRNVSGRLYRSWEHALLYHTDGLRQIAERARRGGASEE